MKIYGSIEDKEIIEKNLAYWENSPAAQRLIKRHNKLPIIPLKKFPAVGANIASLFMLMNKEYMSENSSMHIPSVLIHEFRHSDQWKHHIVDTIIGIALYKIASHSMNISVDNKSLALQILTCVASYYCAASFSCALRNIHEGDARSFTARVLLEKAAAEKGDELSIEETIKATRPGNKDTGLELEQLVNVAASAMINTEKHGNFNDFISDTVPKTRKAWIRSDGAKSYNKDVTKLVWLSAMAPIMNGMLKAKETISWEQLGIVSMTIILTHAAYRAANNKHQLSKPFDYIMDKVAAKTIPEYNP